MRCSCRCQALGATLFLAGCIVASCSSAEAGNPAGHHGTERGAPVLHPADHACESSDLAHGDIVEILEGALAGLRAKVLEKSPSGRHHCHVLVAVIDPHIDVLSVIGVYEVELLRKLQR